MVSIDQAIGQFIGGRWTVPSSADAVSHNPARLSDEVLSFAYASSDEIDDAFSAAASALARWSAVPAVERGRLVRRAAARLEERLADLAVLLTRDSGKTLEEAKVELSRTIETLHFHASQTWTRQAEQFASSRADEKIEVVRLPVGVVAIITPFNFPAVVPAWKLAPALVQGNTVVWKPAELDPAFPVQLASIFSEVGLPAGVLNLVQGPGGVGAAVGSHPGADAVSFTGSVRVGKEVAHSATRRGIRVQAEMGGHNAAIVFSDADLQLAAREVVRGAMLGAGQKCTSTRRVIVVERLHESLLELIGGNLADLRIGDGLDSTVNIGPLITSDAQQRVEQSVAVAEEQGARRLQGGTLVAGNDCEQGHFMRPTLLLGVTHDMTIAQEEVFGPVVSVMSVEDEDEAISLANSTMFGLSASIFTADARRIRRCIRELDVGVLHVNSQTAGNEPHVPFGGRRDSSLAYAPPEQGDVAKEFYSQLKTIYVDTGT
jgi:alpha-ketoglutaric semialdehyde dehydrogenase